MNEPTTLYVPCELGQVRVKLGFGDSLSPLEETALAVVAAAAHPTDDTAEPTEPVDVSRLSALLGLGRRVVLDLVHDLWRAGHLVVDFATGHIDLSPDVLGLWRGNRLHTLSGVETEERVIELMIDRLTGYVAPARGPYVPGDRRTAVAGLAVGQTLADAAQVDLHVAVRGWLHQRGRPGNDGDTNGDTNGDRPADTWLRDRRILSIRAPIAGQRGGGQRWMPLTVRSKLLETSEAAERVIVTVVDNRFPVERRELASERLTQLVADNPREPFAIRLREAAEQGLADPPGLEELIERLADDAARCATTVPGRRHDEHRNLVDLADKIGNLLLTSFAREVDVDLVVGVAEHDRVLAELIERAERQLVIVSPFVTYDGLNQVAPALRRATKKGVQVIVLWGVGYQSTLPDNVHNALSSMARMSAQNPLLRPGVSTRTHAKLVIRDDVEALVTSCNPLSRGRSHNEIGMRLRASTENDQAIRDLLEWVQTNLPGTISHSVRQHAEHFGRPPVPPRTPPGVDQRPEPPPEDDTNPTAVRAWSRYWEACADWLRERLAERQRPTVRLVEDGTHRHLLWHALATACRRLVITSGGLSDEVVDGRMVQAIRERLAEGVVVTVGFDERARSDRFAAAFDQLSALAKEFPHRFRLHTDTGHAKVLVWDDNVAVGSFNYLSQGGYGVHGGRHLNSTELSVRLSDAAVAARIAIACGEPPGLTEHLTGTGPRPAVASRRDPVVAKAVQDIVAAPAEEPVGPLVRRALGGLPEPRQVLEALESDTAAVLTTSVAAYCLSESVDDAATRRRLVGELWRAGRFMEAALLSSADVETSPRQAIAVAVANRGLPGAADALAATAERADLTDDEAAVLLISAIGEVLAIGDESATLVVLELTPRVGSPWAELSELVCSFSERTVGVPAGELMAALHWERQRDNRLAAGWERVEISLLDAKPLPAKIDGARRTRAALFKQSGMFGRIEDMVGRRDLVALARLIETEFHASSRDASAISQLLDRTWREVAPASDLLEGRRRTVYLRRLTDVVTAARELLDLAAGDAPAGRSDPELLAAAKELADGYASLKDGLTASSALVKPVVSAIRAELDDLMAGVARPLSGTAERPGLSGMVANWAGRWQYPNLAAGIMTAPSEKDAARLLLADLVDGPRTPEQAATALVAMYEFDAVDTLRAELVLSSATARAIQDLVETARAETLARVQYEAAALQRRAHRAGTRIDVGDLVATAAHRPAEADTRLAALAKDVAGEEETRAANLITAAQQRAKQLGGVLDEDSRRAVAGWLELIRECVQAREFEVALNLVQTPDPTRPSPAGPRTVPRLREVWPYQQSAANVLSWYRGATQSGPPSFESWIPELGDVAAWRVYDGLSDYIRNSGRAEAAALCAAVQELVGGARAPVQVAAVGPGFRGRIVLPDFGSLPELAVLGRGGVATWIAGPEHPPAASEPTIWLLPDFGAPPRVPPGVAVVDLPFLLRLMAPVADPAQATAVREANLLRRLGVHLGPASLLADLRGPVTESQVGWLLHLLGAGADGVTAEALHYDSGGRLEVLGPLLRCLLPNTGHGPALDVAALNRARGDDTWRVAALDRLFQPFVTDLPAALVLRTAAAFYDGEFTAEDVRDAVADAADPTHYRLIQARMDLPSALARLVRGGLLDSPKADIFRLPPNGLRDILGRERPGYDPLELARSAITAEYNALRDATAVRRAEISERVVQFIGHHVYGKLSSARSALDRGDLDHVALSIDGVGSVHDMYRRATEPDQAVDLHQLLNEVAQDCYLTHPDTECSVGGIDGLRVMANNWILRQAFHNLVDNSRRACERRGVGFGKVRMTIDTVDSPLAGKCCRVDIEDDGTGFSADTTANVQAGARASQWGGRGIGIRTARSWFEEYGGSLEIMPSPGQLGGAHVLVVLPIMHTLSDDDAVV